ncbi:uncharacterized protein LOC142358264, partial [Convolutriloba macropyga]|uniref:uncharacterized protein LOC142358264 n=1 Tax=Convolutriloba macropyga TaxID=536237 RepID=UPI003F525D03
MMIKLGPGYFHDLSLSLFKYVDKSGKTDCIAEGTKGILKYSSDYSYFLCVDECMLSKENSSCGCNTMRYTLSPTKTCGQLEMLVCPYDNAQALSECYLECKPQCDFTSYEIKRQSTKFPGKSVVSVGNNDVKFNVSKWRENAVDIQIRFGSTVATEIQ